MVGRDDLPNAIALNSMTFNAARVIGPAFGGLLLATVGSAWCFAINGLSFMAVIVSLLVMQIPPMAKHNDPRSPWQQLKSGIAYSVRNPELRGLLLLALFFSTFGIAYMTVLPAFVDQVLKAGPTAFGLITSAAGLGAVIGALSVARYGDSGYRGRMLFAAAVVFPIVLTVFAVTTNFIASLFLTFLLGVGFMVQFTQINTLLQNTRGGQHARPRAKPVHADLFWLYALRQSARRRHGPGPRPQCCFDHHGDYHVGILHGDLLEDAATATVTLTQFVVRGSLQNKLKSTGQPIPWYAMWRGVRLCTAERHTTPFGRYGVERNGRGN